MKYLTRNEIVDRAMELYSIPVNNISRASAVKTISKLAKEHPIEARKKYEDQALKKGNEYYYPEKIAISLLLLAESYFSKFSTDPEIRDMKLFKNYHEMAKDEKEICNIPGDYVHNRRAQLQKNEEVILMQLEEKTGLTIAKIEESCKDAIWYDQRDLSMLINYANYALTDVKIPPIISRGRLEVFYQDRNLELIEKKYEEWSDVPFITGCQKRSWKDIEELNRKTIECMTNAVFELFFEPFDTMDLYDDLNIVSDHSKEHHDEEYYLAVERYTRHKSYCKLKETPFRDIFLEKESFEKLKKDFVDAVVEEITEKAAKKITKKVLEEINRQKRTIKI